MNTETSAVVGKEAEVKPQILYEHVCTSADRCIIVKQLVGVHPDGSQQFSFFACLCLGPDGKACMPDKATEFQRISRAVHADKMDYLRNFCEGYVAAMEDKTRWRYTYTFWRSHITGIPGGMQTSGAPVIKPKVPVVLRPTRVPIGHEHSA